MRWLFVALFSLTVPLAAVQYRVAEDGPIHEAFLTPVQGSTVLEAVSSKPPAPVKEKAPERVGDDSIWIPGHWAWMPERNDFIWVSGVWRKPPPGHHWIEGYWKSFDEGWVYLPGFWSPLLLSEVDFLEQRPPEPINEEVNDPEGDNYFWMPGYWTFDKLSKRYSWLGGRWEELSNDWVWVPAQYVWRPGGYIFIDGYWDWPIEKLGQAYANAYVEAGGIEAAVWEPTVVLQPGVIIRRLFVYYPDYICWFHHHHHFHPGWWGHWCCTPPWWGWGGWWGFSWQNQWGMWWWWGHPGWPQPFWLNAALAQQIMGPGQELFPLLKNAHPPAIISPKGLLDANALLKIKDDVLGDGALGPILPADQEQLDDIMGRADLELKEPPEILRPEATKPPQRPLPRPDTLKPGERPIQGAGRVDAPPPRPMQTPPSARPPIRRVEPAEPPPRRTSPRLEPRRPRPQVNPDRRPRPRPESYPETRPRPRPQTRPRPRPDTYPEFQPRRPSPRPTPQSTPRPRETPQTGPRQSTPRQSSPRRTAPPSEIQRTTPRRSPGNQVY